jgi:hypothetical protein
MREIDRFRHCLGRHIKELANFDGIRACDRRLKKLIESGYIERKKILYGVPSLYTLTYKGKKLIGATLRVEKIKIEQIMHDISVIDTIIYLTKTVKISKENIVTEKQLHQADGFGVRKHQPDLVIYENNKTTCVEIELTLKAEHRLTKNISDNFAKYDNQLWIIPQTETKIRAILSDNKEKYGDSINILSLEEVKKASIENAGKNDA